MMYKFDEFVFESAKNMSSVYTRYADDLFISSNDKYATGYIFHKIREHLDTVSDVDLKINDEKTIYLSKKQHREITGVVLTSDGRLSVGRERKRMIKSKVFKAINNELSQKELAHLAGLISWTNSIEPEFVTSLRLKYSNEKIDHIRRCRQDSIGK